MQMATHERDAAARGRERICDVRRGAPITTIQIDTCRVHGARDGADDFDRVGLAAALGGVASAFFDRFYALPKERGAFAIASVIGAAAGSALVHSLAPPLRRFLPADTSEFFRPTRARVEVDGKTLPFSSFASLQIGAIDINLAGVVRCFKHAREGGVLHFQALSTTPMGVVCNLPNMVLGTRQLAARSRRDDQASSADHGFS